MFRIGMDPDIISTGIFVLSWHGFLSFVAVALAVVLVARWAPRYGISSDDVYATAIWAIIGGILGARVVHVIDLWGYYVANPGQIIAIWNGGIAIWGAIFGGFVGGFIYATINGTIPRGRLADITAPAMLLAMAVGRIGDVINGEHIGKLTSMPWGIVWNHPKSPSFQLFGPVATHPIPVYEILLNLVAFFIIWRFLRDRLKPDGMVFVAYLAAYAFGRFFLDFFKSIGDGSGQVVAWVGGLTEAQIISLGVLAVTVPLLAYRARLVAREEPRPAPKAKAKAARKRTNPS